MKKMYSRLAAIVLAFVGTLTAGAQSQYYDVDPEPSTTITVGQDYVLHPAFYSNSLVYIHDTELSTSVDEKSVLQFEDAGLNEAGEQTYLLKQMSTGRYLQAPAVQTDKSSIVWTESKSRAWRFTAKAGVPNTQEPDDIQKAGGTVDYSTYYLGGVDNAPEKPDCIVFAYYDWRKTGFTVGTWLSGYLKPTWDPVYTNTCNWYAYKATKASAYNSLCYVYDHYFGNGQKLTDYFTVGTRPGEVSQALFDAVKKDSTELGRLFNDNTQNDAVYTEAQKAFEESFAAAKAGIIGITPGYYVIRNHEADRADGNGCIFDNGTNIRWKKFEYDGTQALNADDATFIWQVIKADGGKSFYLRNYYSGQYIGRMADNYQAVPVSAQPVQDYYIEPQKDGAFSIYTKGVNDTYPALHAQGDGNSIVIWETAAGASGWYFTPVSDAALNSLAAGIAQAKLNKEAKALLPDAEMALAKGISVKSAATRDSLYTDPGFITDGGHFWTNAQETKEGNDAHPDMGYPQYLVDNDETTYFHTSWSDASLSSLTHYLGVDLGEAMQYLTLKYSRRNTGNNGTPMTIHVYAVNDTTGTAAGTCPWADQGYVTFTYTLPANETYTTPGTPNFTGLTSVALDAPYRYIRLDVEHTISDARTNGNLYFHLSELHLYKGSYDAATSLIEAVPAAITAELKSQIAAMKAQLAAGKVDQAGIDALKAALQKFNDNLPDPAGVRTLIADARAQLAAAEEGTDLGYFKQGSKAAFENDIKAVEAGVKDMMTIDEVNAAKAGISKAIATFDAALNKPADGTIYFIKSATSSDAEGTAAGNYIYAANSDSSDVYWGGKDDENLSERLDYMWRAVANADGSYAFRNVANGTYLGNPVKDDVKVAMSLTPQSLKLRSAKAAGLFNFVCADGVYYNAQPGTNRLVTWHNASGADNSAFQLEAVDAANWMNTYHVDITQKVQIVTLPISVTGLATGAKTYKVLGLNGNSIELKAYGEEEEIPAGTPFVYIPDADNDATTTDFMPTATKLDDVAPVSEALAATGLQGTLTATTPGAGVGIIFNGGVIISVADDVVSANSGWFTDAMPTTSEKGDVSLPLDGVITAIAGVAAPAATVDVYTISGVAVRRGVKASTATQGLPAGLYIVGGHKVLVK